MGSRRRVWRLTLFAAIIITLIASCVAHVATTPVVRQAVVGKIIQDDGDPSTTNVIVIELEEYDGVHKRPCDMLEEPACSGLAEKTTVEFFAAGVDGKMSRVVIVPHG